MGRQAYDRSLDTGTYACRRISAIATQSRHRNRNASAAVRGWLHRGRLAARDLKDDGDRYIMIDTADNFEKPRWENSPADRWSERQPITREWLRRVLP